MDINLIRNFVEIVDARSLSAAARKRDITRSKVSKELKALETALGVTLLHRTTRSFLLTAAGEVLYEHGRSIIQEVEAAQGAIDALQHVVTGSVRLSIPIAAGRTLSHTVLPGIITALNQAMPQLCWKVVTTSLDYGVEMLLQGKVDLLMCHAQPAIEGSLQGHHLAWLPVGQDTLIPVSIPLVHQLPKKSK